MKFPLLDEDTLHFGINIDPSISFKSDLTSEIGYIVLLCDKNDVYHTFRYTSKTCKLVVLSIRTG